MTVSIPSNPEAVARAMDTGVVLATDVERIFAPEVELATKKDWVDLLVGLVKLQHSAERFLAAARASPPATRAVRDVNSIEELQRLVGDRGDINSGEELERMLRGRPN